MPLYDEDWDKRRQGDEFAPSSGKVPILWDGDAVVWDSLAIVEYLNDKVGGGKFWPEDMAARAMARSMAAEMHSGFASLRRKHTMNIRQVYPPSTIDPDVRQELSRIMELWAQARARFGGDGEFLFGAFGAPVRFDDVIEASGGLRLAQARDVALTGVDFLAVGQLTHSAPQLDIGLDVDVARG